MASLIERNGVFYVTDRLSGKIVRHSLRTDSLQMAKEKLRQYQSAQCARAAISTELQGAVRTT